MTIDSPAQLEIFLNDMQSLNDNDRQAMMDTARFLPNGGPIASL